jgi:hypothetical protein
MYYFMPSRLIYFMVISSCSPEFRNVYQLVIFYSHPPLALCMSRKDAVLQHHYKCSPYHLQHMRHLCMLQAALQRADRDQCISLSNQAMSLSNSLLESLSPTRGVHCGPDVDPRHERVNELDAEKPKVRNSVRGTRFIQKAERTIIFSITDGLEEPAEITSTAWARSDTLVCWSGSFSVYPYISYLTCEFEGMIGYGVVGNVQYFS